MSRPVGVGVIGAGYWGTKLIGEYLAAQEKGNVKLVKICDASLSRLLACEEKFHLHYGLFTQRFEEVIGNPKVSAVHIAAPNQTHYALAKIALEAGKDVLVEKPMTLNSKEAYELVDVASAKGRVLHVGHIFRYNSALHSACQILQEKRIGRIFYVRIQWTDQAYLPERDIVFDLGPHPIDVLNQLLQDWPMQVSGFARGYRGQYDKQEVAYAIAEFHDHAFAHIELSWLHPKKVREVTVVGSEATLLVDCLDQKVVLVNSQGREELRVTANNTIEAEIDHFIDRVLRRDTSAESGMIGAQTVEVLETIRSSMWSRPMPPIRKLQIEPEMNIINILERVSTGESFSDISRAGNGSGERYLGILERAGLLRSNETPENAAYEVTETGAKFLKEYQDLISASKVERARAQ